MKKACGRPRDLADIVDLEGLRTILREREQDQGLSRDRDDDRGPRDPQRQRDHGIERSLQPPEGGL